MAHGTVDHLVAQFKGAIDEVVLDEKADAQDVMFALKRLTKEWVMPEKIHETPPEPLPGGGEGGGGTDPPPVEPPVVTGLSPDTAVANAPDDITMTVEGSGFTSGSVITFNGNDEPTTLISPTQVSTGVKPSLFEVPAVCPVAVRNPDGQTSASVDFTFTEAPASRTRR